MSAVLTGCCCFSDRMQKRLHESNTFPWFVSLKPWSQQDPFLSLKIQAWSEIYSFEILRIDYRTHFVRFAFTRSTYHFARFFSTGRLSLNKMVWYQAQYPSVSLLCCYMPPKRTWLAIFSNYFPSLSQTKYRNTESSCSRFDVTSGPRPVKLGREPKWRHFDVFWSTLTSHRKSKISQIKKKKNGRKLLHKISFIILAKNKFCS